jgi:predicted HTH transcriptional regulator
MRIDFGTKEVRENDPLLKGFINYNQPTRALKRVDHLIEKVGIGLVQTVEKYYKAYLDKPNESNAKKFVLWRLRLHRRMKNEIGILREINESRPLGLNDESMGITCWDMNFD